MYRQILVPTDGSQGSLQAAEHAIELATTVGAGVHALYVVQSAVGPDAAMAGAYEAFEEAGQDAVDAVAERAESAGVATVVGSLASGSPHEAIRSYAEEHEVDLIVMGTHGRTGLDRYLIGSVTEKVVRTVDVPVLTVNVQSGLNGGDS